MTERFNPGYVLFVSAVFLVTVMAAVTAWAQPETVPGAANEIYRGIQDKNILMAIGGGIFLLIELLKTTLAKGLMLKIPSRFRGLAPAVLAVAGMVVWGVVHQQAEWSGLLYDTVTAGGTATVLHQALKKAMLGK